MEQHLQVTVAMKELITPVQMKKINENTAIYVASRLAKFSLKQDQKNLQNKSTLLLIHTFVHIAVLWSWLEND